ncbi:MAG TPA: CHASE3 domain-containing protein [Stellaceae bacterium]|nr:CHASE3 domain-containing protein [Stellaceae bacterium]
MAHAAGGPAAVEEPSQGWSGQRTQQSAKGFRFFSEPFRSLILVIAPSLVLLGIVVYNAFSIIPNLQRSQAEVAHTFKVIDTARGLDHALQDAERGQRGFLITGDDEYLRSYSAGVKDAPARLGELRQLTADEPEQLDRVAVLDKQVAEKLQEMQQTVDVRRKQGFDAARWIVQTNFGLDAMQKITAEIDAAIATENIRLRQHQDGLVATARSSAVSNLIASGLALSVTLLGGGLLVRSWWQTKRAELSLAQSEERFRLLVSGVTDYAILMLDPRGLIVSWNEGAQRIKGYSAAEILGSHISRFYPPGEASAGTPDRLLEIAAQAGRAEAEGWRLRTDGSRFWANVVITALRGDDGSLRGFAKITRDITERRDSELALERNRTTLAQMQKMEALGQLTGGVAHDFNNNLTAILGNIELIQRGSGSADPERTSRLLAAAQRAAERAAELTSRLLAFSRRQPLEPRIVDVNKLVGSMSEMLHRTLGETALIETVLAAGLWRTNVDLNQLESAILNLAVNARDAMPEGGKLTIETGNTYLDDHYAAVRTEVKSGQYVMIAVSDTGEGMSGEILAHAFEPFFTTKPEGKGTGLGLSQVHGFVKQSGGHIELYSEIGQGTTIKIYLPRSLAQGEAAAEEDRPVLASTPVGETVLVVDDNESVRRFGADALVSLGYKVFEAANAEAALRILETHPETALLFTDVGLPSINGRGLADAARQRIPDLKVLYTTGYARNAIVHHGTLDAGVELLAKPFTVEALGRKLQQMLRSN